MMVMETSAPSSSMGGAESSDVIKSGLGLLGKHPMLLSHCYLSLSLPNRDLESIEILANYPNLMYVDISENKISDLSILSSLPTLVQLNVSGNNITECLNFAPALCNEENSWSSGDEAIGSMLTMANLSHNRITHLGDLSRHLFLETLMLSNNSIQRIEGLENLKYLLVLDLSYNKITSIEGMDGLRITELSLEGNQIKSLVGLGKLLCLSVLNISRNNIQSLYPLTECTNLVTLNAAYNEIRFLRQTQFLKSIPWLAYLTLRGNPCQSKANYRYRVLYRLPNLRRLDVSDVIAEEIIRSCNLYGAPGGDIEGRRVIFHQHFPSEVFEDYGPTANFDDEEEALELGDLMATEYMTGVSTPLRPPSPHAVAAHELAANVLTHGLSSPDVHSAHKASALLHSSSRAVNGDASFREGDRVQGNYRGHGHWYGGIVVRVHEDLSCDVDYDDGEREERLDPGLLRSTGEAIDSALGEAMRLYHEGDV